MDLLTTESDSYMLSTGTEMSHYILQIGTITLSIKNKAELRGWVFGGTMTSTSDFSLETPH